MARIARSIRPTRRTSRPHSMRSCRRRRSRWSVPHACGQYAGLWAIPRRRPARPRAADAAAPRDRDRLYLRAQRLRYEWGVHCFFAAKVNSRLSRSRRRCMAAMRNGQRTSGCCSMSAKNWTPRGRSSDDLWARLTRHFSCAEILEIIALVGFYRTVSLYANALRLPLEPNSVRFPATPIT